MKYILDTHALIWALEGDSKLSKTATNLILDKNNQIYVSAASLWEMSIKMNLGKLSSKLSVFNTATEAISLGIEIVSINYLHAAEYENLPNFNDHKDPFDRIIISTAIVEDLKIIPIDEKFDWYKEIVTIVW